MIQLTAPERELLSAIGKLLDIPTPIWDDREAYCDTLQRRTALLAGAIEAATTDSGSSLKSLTRTVRFWLDEPLGYRPWQRIS